MDNRNEKKKNTLSKLFELRGNVDTVLLVSMVYLNRYLQSERSSIFLFQPHDEQLTIYTSLDLEKYEVSIPKEEGVAGWVFEHGKGAVVNNACEDSRFCEWIDKVTGFQTHKIICAPLIDSEGSCFGTIQSLNKTNGDYSEDDLEVLNHAAKLVADVIDKEQVNTQKK
jgi:adenylate cyclase